jgi:tetratricopeptide (TPR) repeat protein
MKMSLGSIAVALLAAGAPALAQTAAPPPGEAPTRVLVAPLPEGAATSDPIGQVLAALPRIIAEAVSADTTRTASLAWDLPPDALASLGLGSASAAQAPGAAKLGSKDSVSALRDDGSVRVLLLPSFDPGDRAGDRAKGRLDLKWVDLVEGKEGTVTEKASDAAELIEAAGRAAMAAGRAWSASWKDDGAASGAGRRASVSRISEVTSRAPAALEAWARAGAAWNGGDVPAAESALDDALKSDASFDRARVDLAWIRLAEGRNKEAADLAGRAAGGKHLSASARALADVIVAAGTGSPDALEAVAGRLRSEPSSSPWGSLASGLALNLRGEGFKAIAPLDGVRVHRPNDPGILHQAGMAALGEGDYAEALTHLSRAATMWPAHDRIQMDLAETKLRAHDLPGADKVLEAWGERYRLGDRPIWGGEYTNEDPPPVVRSQMITVLTGAVSKAIDFLDKKSALLDAASAPAPLRLIMYKTIHTLQLQLAFGDEIQKHKWLDAARETFTRIRDLTPPEEQKNRPWILLRLEALLRVHEGRLPEAKELRAKVAAVSSLPGFEPVTLSEIDAAIALKEADTDKVFAAQKEAVERRGSLEDLYFLGQSYGIVGKWKEAEDYVTRMESRLDSWSVARRQDALLWTPRSALLVPFIYSLGGETGVWLGKVDYSRSQFGIFLAYFRAPDVPLQPFAREAVDRGSTAAW